MGQGSVLTGLEMRVQAPTSRSEDRCAITLKGHITMHLPLRSNQYYETLRGGYMDCIYKQNVKQRQGRWWWKTLARHLRQPRFDTSAISATPGENTLPPTPLNPAPSPPPSVCGQQPDALRLTSDGGTTSTANNSTSIPWVSTAAP